jgi:hypothetical protein
MGVNSVRNIVLVAGAAAALAVAPQVASAAPVLGGAALNAAVESAAPVENVTYYGYYGYRPRYYGYGGYYRPRYYGYYNYYQPYYGGYGYYRPYRSYRYY